MSVSPVWSVWCENCGNWEGQEPTKRDARKAAKQKGWSCVRGAGELVDLCPPCSEENKKSEAKHTP